MSPQSAQDLRHTVFIFQGEEGPKSPGFRRAIRSIFVGVDVETELIIEELGESPVREIENIASMHVEGVVYDANVLVPQLHDRSTCIAR